MANNLFFTPIHQKAVTLDGKFTPEMIAFFKALFKKLDGVTPTDDHGDLAGLADDDHTQYHTDARALAWLATRSTSDLPEGTRLYFTDERVDDRVAALLAAGAGISISYNDVANTLTIACTITQYTDEMAQDAVGGILTNSATVTFTYNDAANTITASIITTGDWTGTFDGQEGTYYLSRANHTGTQLSTTISDFNEAAQDAVGSILTDSSSIDFTYNDAANTITAIVNPLGLTSTYPLMDYGGYKFDGSTNYLDTNPLTGIVASKTFSFALRVRFTNAASATEILMSTNGNYLRIDRTSTGNIVVQARNAAATLILNMTTSGTPCSAAGEYQILIAVNLNTAGTGRIHITKISDGTATSTVTETTYTNDSVGFATPAEYAIGASNSGSSFFNGDMYLFWFDAANYIDFSTESNRRKFLSPDLKPVFLGWQGELPTGSQPILFLGYDSYTNWFRNRGSAISTSFTEHGTPAAVTTALNGQYAGGRNGNKIRVVTAAGAAYVGIADDAVAINKTVGAATTVNLPKATGSGKRYIIIDAKGDAGANNITLTPPSGTINGAATLVLNVNYEAAIIQDVATDLYARV